MRFEFIQAEKDNFPVDFMCRMLQVTRSGYYAWQGRDAVFHSDRGSQYASRACRQALEDAGIVCSMSRKGDCWDNAVAESFFATLKTELVYRTTFHTRADARLAVAEYIEVFYNRKRMHSHIGYASPVEFEKSEIKTNPNKPKICVH